MPLAIMIMGPSRPWSDRYLFSAFNASQQLSIRFNTLQRHSTPERLAVLKRVEQTARLNTNRQEDGEAVSNRQVGYGLVFGVPKSLSIYLAITGDQVVENIARSAVEETMGAMESEMQCKVRKGGLYEDRRTGELLYSKFFHRDSRPINGLSEAEGFLQSDQWPRKNGWGKGFPCTGARNSPARHQGLTQDRSLRSRCASPDLIGTLDGGV